MAATEPRPTCPAVAPDRLFPRGGKRPAGAIVTCPHCRDRHWLALSAATHMSRCPKTLEPFLLDYEGG